LYVLEKLDVLVCSQCIVLKSVLLDRSAKPDVLELETGGSGICKGSNDLGKTAMVEHVDWRTPLIRYLGNPSHAIDT
jgi:hypothetical protein